MAYPDTLDTLAKPTASAATNNPSHSGLHTAVSQAIEAIETELGINPSGAVTTVAARLAAAEAELDTATSLATANTLAVRATDGTLSVGTPVDAADAATKAYVDNAFSSIPNAGAALPPSPQFGFDGNLAIGSGARRIYNDTGRALTIFAVRATVASPPTGSVIRLDINLNDVTIFTTQANRPIIAAGARTSGRLTGMTVTSWPSGQYMTFDVDEIGSTFSGADLDLQITVGG